jgi:hypothetical protein
MHARQVLLVVLAGQFCIAVAAAALRPTISVLKANINYNESACIASMNCARTPRQEAGVETRSQVLN